MSQAEASIAKVVVTETAGRVIPILCGMRVAKAMPLERWYREVRIRRIGDGPSKVQRMALASQLLT